MHNSYLKGLFIIVIFHLSFVYSSCPCKGNYDCNDYHCADGTPLNYCFESNCVYPCKSSSDCPSGMCGSDGVCGCLNDSGCPSPFPYCYTVENKTYGACLVCKFDEECVEKGMGSACLNGNCVNCRDHLQCPSGMFCRKDNICHFCNTDDDCPVAIGQYCYNSECCVNPDCKCQSNADCSVWFPNCMYDEGPKRQRCVGCSEQDCDSEKPFCHNNLCCKTEGCSCTTHFDCPEASYCANNVCKKCPLHASHCP